MQNSTSASSGGSVVRELKRKDQTLVIMDLPIKHIQARNCHNTMRAVISNLYVWRVQGSYAYDPMNLPLTQIPFRGTRAIREMDDDRAS